MRIIFNSLFFLLIGIQSIKAQTIIINNKPAKYMIDVSVYNGVTFNSMNVRNDNVYPSTLSVPSATYLSQKIAVDFHRTNQYGVIYGGGVELGSCKQDFNYEYASFDFIDPNAPILKTVSKRAEYRNSSGYIGLRLFLGYCIPVHPFGLKSTTLEGKIQIGKQVIFKGAFFNNDTNVGYIANDSTINIIPRALQLFGFWGSGGGTLVGPVFTETNIGFRKEISKSTFNSIYVGFYGSLNLGENNIEVSNAHYDNIEKPYFDHDRFQNKDFTVGLKVGFGLKI